jgi:hypothetical protein
MTESQVLAYLVLDEEQRQRAGNEVGILQMWRKAGTDEVALIVARDALESLSAELRSALDGADLTAVSWPHEPSWSPDWPSGSPTSATPYGPGAN